MNATEKFMRMFGSIFFAVGVITLITGIFSFGSTGDILGDVISVSLGVVFSGIGGGIYIAQMKKGKKRKQINEEGTRYTGKIYGYVEDKNCTMNGDYPVNIIVHYFDKAGVEREAYVPTGFIKGSGDYPIGATIDIMVLGTEYTWDKDSVRYEKIDGEEELMDDKPVTPDKNSMIAVSCASCGASYTAVKGYVSKCPYCGSSTNN